MKKRFVILPVLASLALGGCSLFGGDEDWMVKPEITGGSKAEKTAIYRALNELNACQARKNDAYADLFPTAKNIAFSGDDNDFLRVANKVNVDDKYLVEITWDFKESQATFDAKVAADDEGNTTIVYLKYPEIGGEEGVFEWSITKITCGKAVSEKTNCDYSGKVLPRKIPYVKKTIAELYEMDESAGQTFTIDKDTDKEKTYSFDSTSPYLNYLAKDSKGKYSPYWNPDHEFTYYYVEVSGKVVYLSPDGNWGLLADGDHMIEIYSGSALDLNKGGYPEILSDWVTVRGELGSYYGNFQFSFINSVRKCEQGTMTVPSKNFAALSEANLNSARLSYAGSITGTDPWKKSYKQFNSIIEFNSLREVQGTVGKRVEGSNGRFTINLTVGGETLIVAYDYHTDDKANPAIKDALEGGYAIGKTLKIKGTMRYNNVSAEKSPVAIDTTNLRDAGGHWEIVPFEASHVSYVA